MINGEVEPRQQELLERARDGDRDAFGELAWRHQDAVYTLAVRLVGPDLAPDVAQETLLRAWRALPRFRGDAALSTWLYRITVNTALTMRRRAARHETLPLDESHEAPGLAPDKAGDMVGLRAGLRRAIAGLTVGQRSVLVLRDIYGWTNSETARELGITETTAKVRLHRAHVRLRRLLEGER